MCTQCHVIVIHLHSANHQLVLWPDLYLLVRKWICGAVFIACAESAVSKSECLEVLFWECANSAVLVGSGGSLSLEIYLQQYNRKASIHTLLLLSGN